MFGSMKDLAVMGLSLLLRNRSQFMLLSSLPLVAERSLEESQAEVCLPPSLPAMLRLPSPSPRLQPCRPAVLRTSSLEVDLVVTSAWPSTS